MSSDPIDETPVRQVVERHGFDWYYNHETGSTNADVLQYHARHQRDIVAVSESQTAGRGRRGRQWLSPLARNIYCSIGITKEISAGRQGLLSIITGIALCRAIKLSADATVSLKWPNDVLFEGSKLGGILIESRSLAENRFFFAVGFGLNIHMTDDEQAGISQPVTSLDRISRKVDRTDVLIASIETVIGSIREFEPAAAWNLVEEFAQLDAFHGCPIEVISGDTCVRGINRGITPTGQLQLETDQGMQLHSAAEISLRAVAE